MLKYIMAPYKNKNYRIYNASLYCQTKRYRHINMTTMIADFVYYLLSMLFLKNVFSQKSTVRKIFADSSLKSSIIIVL